MADFPFNPTEARDTAAASHDGFIIIRPSAKCCLQLHSSLAASQDIFQFKPTNEIVPFVVQVSLIGQAALHHVEAESVAGLHGGHSSTQGAVPLTHQPTHTLRIGCQLKPYDPSTHKRELIHKGGVFGVLNTWVLFLISPV